MLEPRRLAARAAAARMAATLGEQVGETVGLRVRMQSQVSAKTRIEVVTEGVFARMILDDPDLTASCAVLFDEFHERSLDADLGLALALDAQAGLREDLRLLVMSATLDGARVATLMGEAPLIESEGRAFPVETRYIGRDPGARIEDEVAEATLRALAERARLDPGLPARPGRNHADGARCWRRASRTPASISRRSMARLTRARRTAPCAGAAGPAQDRAGDLDRRDLADDRRRAHRHRQRPVARAALRTGHRRDAAGDAARLRAGADQRRGRAGRTEPGVCYRLWEEAANGALAPSRRRKSWRPISPASLLDLAAWGVSDPVDACAFSIRRRAPPSPRRARC